MFRDWLQRDSMSTLNPKLKRAIGASILLQFGTLFPSAFLLDGGFVFQICLLAAASWWLGTFIIYFRRGKIPTKADLLFLQLGYLAFLPLAALLSPLWGWMRQ